MAILLSFYTMMQSILPRRGGAEPCPYHGVGSCRVAEVNWKVCRRDSEFDGALQSWKEIAKYKDGLARLVDFIDKLFR